MRAHCVHRVRCSAYPIHIRPDSCRLVGTVSFVGSRAIGCVLPLCRCRCCTALGRHSLLVGFARALPQAPMPYQYSTFYPKTQPQCTGFLPHVPTAPFGT
jgi:hypothetical protein